VPALLALLGCHSTYYDAYRSAHPDWIAPEVPFEDMDLEQVVAFAYAPDGVEGIAVEVTGLEIHDSTTSPWRRLELAALRNGEEASRDDTTYAVIVEKLCTTEGGLESRSRKRVAYYLLPDNRLGAWDHYAFRSGCAVSNRFQAARGEVIPIEEAVVDHVVATYGKTPVTLDQLYRRGLAFVAAGRLVEARAALEVAEPAYRAAALRAVREPRRRAALGETTRLRTALMRALGVEENRPGPEVSRARRAADGAPPPPSTGASAAARASAGSRPRPPG
jgi:hypothetical protein